MKITMAHIRQVRGFAARPGFCARGVRAWFERRELDYSDFLKNGIDEKVLVESGDSMAIAVVEQANGVE